MRARGVVAGVLAPLAVLLVPAPGLAGQAADDEQPSAPTRALPTAADPVPAPPVEEWVPPKLRHTAIYWIGGLGTPIGIGGFEAVHRFGESPLELAVGVGNGLTALMANKNASWGSVLQWAVMPRLRAGNDADTLTAGVGISGGNIGDVPLLGSDDGESMGPYPIHYFLWANFEVGGEHWSRSGFALRYFLGLASGCKVSGCFGAQHPDVLPYLGLGLGYAW